GRIQLDIQHLLGNHAALPCPRKTRILNGMLQIEQYPWRIAGIALIHQDGAAAQQIAITFQCEIEHRIEQRMAWADKRGERWSLRRYERLFEGNALMALQNRIADADK